MNFYRNWPWWKSVIGMQPDPKVLATREAEGLAFEVLQRELSLIDDQFRIKARKAKIDFIQKWLSRQ